MAAYTKTFTIRYWLGIFIIAFGLILAACGAWRTAGAVIIDEQTADALAATDWGHNEALKRALMDQSHAASWGLWLIVFGSALQFLGTFLSARGKP